MSLRSDSLVLSFPAKDDPSVRCAAPSQPMGPEFPIPALKAGSYRVFARSLFPCMVEGPAICLMESVPCLVDTLKVEEGNAFPPGWFLRPGRIEAGKAGRYPVYAASAPGRTLEKPACLLPIPYERVDTLIVTASTALGEIPGPSRALGEKSPAGRRRPAAVPTFGRDGLPWLVTPEGRRVAQPPTP